MWSSMRETASSTLSCESASTHWADSALRPGPSGFPTEQGTRRHTGFSERPLVAQMVIMDRAWLVSFSVDHLETPPEGGEASARLSNTAQPRQRAHVLFTASGRRVSGHLCADC